MPICISAWTRSNWILSKSGPRWQVDPLECLNCGATLRIIALIDDSGLCGVFLSDECPEMAVSGLSKIGFCSNRTSGIHPKADIQLKLTKRVANDPKPTFKDGESRLEVAWN